ncbi:MAG: caspase family protein [Phycisphaerae bacterium]|nr:caspase family protein [Phycisphaerae bacterium]
MTGRLQSEMNGWTRSVLLTVAIAGMVVASQAVSLEAQQYQSLVVGLDQYEPSYCNSPLQACVNDAVGFKDAILRDGKHWDATRVSLLTNAQATKETIVQRLRDMAANAGPGDVCVYYQASHGGQYDGANTFLCAYDADFTDQELGAELANFNGETTVIVVIDACHSGGLFKRAADGMSAAPAGSWSFAQNAMTALRVTRATRAATTGEPLPRDLGTNIGFITACDYDQTSNESNGHGLFTGHLLDALQGATADTNGDQQHSFWELYAYAAPKATQDNPQQTAQSYNQGTLECTVAITISIDASGSTIKPDGEDEYEENDSMQQAVTINPGTYNLVGMDEDWFHVSIEQQSNLVVKIDGPEGDLDLYVLDSQGNVLGASEEEGSQEGLEGLMDAGDLLVVVAPYEGQTSGYTMTVTLSDAGSSQPSPEPSPDPSTDPWGDLGSEDIIVPITCGVGVPLPMMAAMLGLVGLGTMSRRHAR